jgi:hypothetical protein
MLSAWMSLPCKVKGLNAYRDYRLGHPPHDEPATASSSNGPSKRIARKPLPCTSAAAVNPRPNTKPVPPFEGRLQEPAGHTRIGPRHWLRSREGRTPSPTPCPYERRNRRKPVVAVQRAPGSSFANAGNDANIRCHFATDRPRGCAWDTQSVARNHRSLSRTSLAELLACEWLPTTPRSPALAVTRQRWHVATPDRRLVGDFDGGLRALTTPRAGGDVSARIAFRFCRLRHYGSTLRPS